MTTRLDNLQNKIVDLAEAKRRMGIWRNAGLKVAFTNGCFDIIHKGHVTYLTQAAEYANRLVIGLNTDSSVKRQGKGSNRPINNEVARQTVLAALGVVDLVVLFDENTPYELICELMPDFVIKGADYDPNETDASSKKYIVGKDVMDKNGGQTIAIPIVEGFSTTKTIEKIIS